MTVRFGAPVTLPPLCWLLLKAAQGEAIWLAQAAPDAAIQLLDRADAGAPWQPGNAIAGLRGLCRIRTDAEQGAQPLGLALAGQQIALHAAPAPAPGSAQTGASGGKLHADIAAALGAFLATQPAGHDATVPFLFTTSVGGLVTVYAPRIEYDI